MSSFGDLATHDSNIDGDLAAHDSDIKAKLDNLEKVMNARFDKVDAQLREINKLLKTPGGQREEWNEMD